MFSYQFKAMGGPCEIRLDCHDRALADRTFARAQAEINRLEAKYSRYRDDSLLSAINRSAGSGLRLEMDPESAGLLQHAHTLWQQSDGLFDISSGILRHAWNFKSGCLPERAAVTALLQRVGWQRVDWDGRHIALPVAGMELDFGGLVKEYACDAAAAEVAREGISSGLVEMAGDIAVTGPMANGEPWAVGIRNPANPQQALASIALHSGGLASSGDYERCVVIDGIRYSHLLDPRSGWPVRGLASVSVSASQCLLAGSVSTVAMLKEQREALDWLEELGLPYLAVDQEIRTYGAAQNS